MELSNKKIIGFSEVDNYTYDSSSMKHGKFWPLDG